jgi:hypothetical protein
MLHQTAEMVLLDCAAAMRKHLKVINETLHDQCLVRRAPRVGLKVYTRTIRSMYSSACGLFETYL